LGVEPTPAVSSDEWLTTAGSSPMPSPPGRGYSDQSDPWMPMVVDRPSYYYPTGCGRGGAWPVKLGPARSSSGSSRWTVYIFFLSETDLHTRDFVHKSYESEITARDIDSLIWFQALIFFRAICTISTCTTYHSLALSYSRFPIFIFFWFCSPGKT
jgi:hypothetical protein